MPGETNPDIGPMVREYLSKFSYHKVQKKQALKQDLYLWCGQYLGEQYKDWFIHEGGKYDKWWTVNIRVPKKSTLFMLRWADIIIESNQRIHLGDTDETTTV